jgi:hypothetical protein
MKVGIFRQAISSAKFVSKICGIKISKKQMQKANNSHQISTKSLAISFNFDNFKYQLLN